MGLFLFSPHLYAMGSHLLTHFEPRFLLPSLGWLLFGLAYLICSVQSKNYKIVNFCHLSII
jgi:hypothetical protein